MIVDQTPVSYLRQLCDCSDIAEFRLVSGPTSGRLEIRHDNIWGTVCDDGFNKHAGDMVCKQLGYLYVEGNEHNEQ